MVLSFAGASGKSTKSITASTRPRGASQSEESGPSLNRKDPAFAGNMKLQLSPELGGSGGTVHPAAVCRACSRARCRFTNAARRFGSRTRLKYAFLAAAMFCRYCLRASSRAAFSSAVQLALAVALSDGPVVPVAAAAPAKIAPTVHATASRFIVLQALNAGAGSQARGKTAIRAARGVPSCELVDEAVTRGPDTD